MTDDWQVVAKSYRYEAFGTLRSEAGSGLLFENRYTYTAREGLGDALGLYYYRWRVMDPNVGRFTSEDPWRFMDGPNTLILVLNQPTNYTDPFGLIRLSPRLCDPCAACLQTAADGYRYCMAAAAVGFVGGVVVGAIFAAPVALPGSATYAVAQVAFCTATYLYQQTLCYRGPCARERT